MGDRLDFSVVVTTRNRPAQLAVLLSALAALDFPPDRFEVVVVDDGSDAPLDPVVAPFTGQLHLRLIRCEHGGPGRGRNTGVAIAVGHYIAFTDDDCEPESGWLRHLKSALENDPDAMVGGKVVNGLASNHYSAASQLIMDLVYAHYNRDSRDARFFATNNMALPRERFQSLGGFDEEFLFSEDRDLCERWRYARFPMIYEPAAVIRHSHALSLGSFLRQHFSYGKGAARFHRKAGTRGSGKLRDHLGFHRRLPAAAAEIMRPMPASTVAAQSALLLAWQLANAAGFLYGRVRR